ncbi:kinesin-like protein KIF19 isoform X2 [Sciurus carolinensis]|uniref:kinesin-like protein KIF19 isoform X2 n=1 Tax=Sciurus carolinensis TaxID=30640 RepID=UPI001FB4DDBC|nr:kinesin-like protein KIF19 isoform X2 [Sciurus carolinensis]
MKDSGDSKDQQLMVALRVRPISVAELEEGATLIAHKVDEQMVVLMDPMEDPDDILRAHRSREKSYLFDVAFDFTATQEMVYQATTKSLIDGVISGYNATVFAYGPTGCGKTYTMLGTDHEPGIYVRTLNDLFRAIEETSNDMEYEVSMSYLEIYNEMIRDLLNPALGYLELREDSKGVIQVAGITEVSTLNAEEIMQLLTKGNRQRTQEPTAANQTSSRSHAVLQVAVRQRSRVKDILQEVRQGRLFMIDLAGSERASQTRNRGQRMKEGAHINRSLLALGNCISALSDRGSNKYINYRDSKLTRLLKDSLGGNSRTVMIAHISPASTAFEESRNTLTYAGRAKNIRTRVKQNLLSVSYHIAQYTSIIADLRGEIQRLKCKIDQQAGRGQARGQLGRGDIRHIQAEVQLQGGHGEQEEMGPLREQLVSAFQEQMDVRRRLLELENQAMEVQIETSRHLLTIAGWEHEKSRRTLKWREEQRKESFMKDDSEKDSDTGDDQPDIVEPPEVASARESIAALVGKQKQLRKEKLALEQRCRDLRARGRRLEETLPRRIGSEEQREVLSLLCRVHELEVENTEMQSHALLRDGALRHRREAVRRLEQHRSLCDEIIQGQRQIIDDYNLAVPQHLEELYEVYLRELEEGTLERATIMDRVASRALQDSSLPKITPAGATATPDSDLESGKTLSSETQHLQNSTLPPLGTDSDAHHMFKASSRAWQAKSSSVPTPPPIQVGSLVTQETLQPVLSGTWDLCYVQGLPFPNHFTPRPCLPTAWVARSPLPQTAARTCQRSSYPTKVGIEVMALGSGYVVRRKAQARKGRSRWRRRGGSGDLGPSRSQGKGSPAPRHTSWGPTPQRAPRTTRRQRVGTRPLVSGTWEKSRCLWPRSNSPQAITQLAFPDGLLVDPTCPMVQTPMARMDASGTTEGLPGTSYSAPKTEWVVAGNGKWSLGIGGHVGAGARKVAAPETQGLWGVGPTLPCFLCHKEGRWAQEAQPQWLGSLDPSSGQNTVAKTLHISWLVLTLATGRGTVSEMGLPGPHLGPGHLDGWGGGR